MMTATSAPPDLAALRQSKGMSLDQIAQATKIRVRYLEAIERGAYELLPGGLFGASYIRQYARAVGCDDSQLLSLYTARRATGGESDDRGLLTRLAAARSTHIRRPDIGPACLAIADDHESGEKLASA